MSDTDILTGLPLRHALGEDGYARISGPDLFDRLPIAAADWDLFAQSWNDLGPDLFMADGGRYRRRRHATLRWEEGGFIRKSPRDKAVSLINKLATETGGRAFFPESIADLPQIANEIIRDLRTQYVLAYNPTNKTQDGTFRSIRVTVDQPSGGDKRIALTRTGRVARKEGPTGNSPKPPPVKLPAGAGAKKP